MPDITINPATIRPLRGSTVSMSNAAEAMELGDLVYVSGDGEVGLTDADDSATLTGRLGIAVGVSNHINSGAVAAGERVTVLWLGRVAIPGAELDVTKIYYVSNNPGKISDAPGTITRAVGGPETSEIFSFNPDTTVPNSPE